MRCIYIKTLDINRAHETTGHGVEVPVKTIRLAASPWYSKLWQR